MTKEMPEGYTLEMMYDRMTELEGMYETIRLLAIAAADESDELREYRDRVIPEKYRKTYETYSE